MDRRVDGKAGSRIAYSNEKFDIYQKQKLESKPAESLRVHKYNCLSLKHQLSESKVESEFFDLKQKQDKFGLVSGIVAKALLYCKCIEHLKVFKLVLTLNPKSWALRQLRVLVAVREVRSLNPA